MRGIYRVSYLPLLLQHITPGEGELIRKALDNPNYFRYIFLSQLQLESEELEYSWVRFQESSNLVSQLLAQIDLSGNTLTWGWPKGRLQNFGEKELPFNCAQREFREEMETTLYPPLYISDNYVTEYIKTLTGRTIESRYWVYVVAEEMPITPPKNHLEVSARRWVARDECVKLINHDNLFYEVEKIVMHGLSSLSITSSC